MDYIISKKQSGHNTDTECVLSLFSNDFSRAVGEEYLKHFDFTEQTLDHALRWALWRRSLDFHVLTSLTKLARITSCKCFYCLAVSLSLSQIFSESGDTDRRDPGEGACAAAFRLPLPRVQPRLLHLLRWAFRCFLLKELTCDRSMCHSPSFFTSSESVLALTCALMLLNTDLHGQVGNITSLFTP